METPPGIESLGSQPPHPEFPSVLEIPWEVTSGERGRKPLLSPYQASQPVSKYGRGRDALTGSVTKGSVLSDCQLSVYSTEQGPPAHHPTSSAVLRAGGGGGTQLAHPSSK